MILFHSVPKYFTLCGLPSKPEGNAVPWEEGPERSGAVQIIYT